MAVQTPDVEPLRDRVRLYVQVMLGVDLASYLSDVVAPLLIDGWGHVALPTWEELIRYSVTGVLVTAWLLTRFGPARRDLLIALEIGVTLVLAYSFAEVASAAAFTQHEGPVFMTLGGLLLLVVRASLIPSPVWRTVAVGLLAVALNLVIGWPRIVELPPRLTEGLSFMAGAFIVATAVTSHVIYGLRRQVRDAMRLGQYELTRKLGEGGMGVVYKATHLMLRRPTAVKLLPESKVGEQTVARFEREVRMTSRLEHPNSVHIYDYGRTPEGQFYYAMEFLDGLTLQQLVEREGAIGEARAAHILVQAARALAEAHALGLVHRDIKPANIMLCQRGGIPDLVKVLDYGLVKVADQPDIGGGVTQTNAIVGTPQYLAPESITDPEDVSPASDIYALGAVGWFLVGGRSVFEGSTVIEVCAKHLNDAPERLIDVVGRPIDEGYQALIDRCLAKNPEARPVDGADLASALADVPLVGWSDADARAWWASVEGATKVPAEPVSSGKTQLAIDVGGRE